MFSGIRRHKLATGVAATVASLALAGTAFAYFHSAGGQGSASGSVKAPTVNSLELSGSVGPIVPGDGIDHQVTGTIKNPNSVSVQVNHVPTVVGITVTPGPAPDSVDSVVPTLTCTADDFQVLNGGSPSAVPQVIPANGGVVNFASTSTVKFLDRSNVDQSRCAGATVNLNLTLAP